MNNDQEGGIPCPVCKAKMVLQYAKRDPHITSNLTGTKIQVPMRCCKCNINVLVSLDPKELQEEPEEDDSFVEY